MSLMHKPWFCFNVRGWVGVNFDGWCNCVEGMCNVDVYSLLIIKCTDFSLD